MLLPVGHTQLTQLFFEIRRLLFSSSEIEKGTSYSCIFKTYYALNKAKMIFTYVIYSSASVLPYMATDCTPLRAVVDYDVIVRPLRSRLLSLPREPFVLGNQPFNEIQW